MSTLAPSISPAPPGSKHVASRMNAHEATVSHVAEVEAANTGLLRCIPEEATQALEFNVMPGRPVRELLHVTEYRVGVRYAEAHFSREYQSTMKKSPSHLIFLSALVQTQKLIYIAMCEELGFEYRSGADEVIKVWPTWVETSLPRMVRDEDALVHKVALTRIDQVAEKIYSVTVESTVNGLLNVVTEVKIYVI